MSAALYSDPNRAFHYAVVASIVLHGMLLFGISQRERLSLPEPAPALPIVAQLVAPAPPAAPAEKEEPVMKMAEAEKPKPAARKPVPKPAPVAKPKPQPEPAPEAPAVAEAPPVALPAPASEAPLTVAPPAAVARPDPSPAVLAPAEPLVKEMAPDPGTLAQYRLQVIGAARKFKRYPPVALDNNWEGDVVVKMAMGANGKLEALTVQSSSGHKVLDQQALEMFRRASAMVPVPPALRGKDFSFEVRAIYSLKDQDSG